MTALLPWTERSSCGSSGKPNLTNGRSWKRNTASAAEAEFFKQLEKALKTAIHA